jgi:DNA repair exonuclease SbcCD ATPase subunit
MRLLLAGTALAAWAFAGTLSAAAAEAPAAEGGEKARVLTPAEHWAKGEVAYDGEWMSIAKLFEKYREARNELRHIKAQGGESHEQLEELQREMAAIRSEERKEEQPIRRELGQARMKLREYNAVLRRKPPERPQMQQMPPPPRRPSNSYDRNYGSSSSRSGTSGWYDQARRDWQRQCDLIKRNNEQRMQQYQQEMKEYQQKINDARTEVPKLEATIKDCMQKLGEVEAEFDNKEAPTLNRTESVTERVRAHQRRVEVVETRLEQLTKALRDVPEKVRLAHSIIEFEKEFHSADELAEEHRRSQAEIDRVREKLRGECEKAGIPFPDDWAHPQQPRLDQMKALLDASRQARAAAK